MQLSINPVQQNPNFGHFTFSPDAANYLKKHIKPNELDRFKKIVEEEAKNKSVEASIDKFPLFSGLSAYLRIFSEDKKSYLDYKDIGEQGFLSRVFYGPVGFLEKVSKQSSKMLEQFELAQKVKSTINNAL